MNNLYVIVRNDLSRSQKTVQAIHASAEYILYEDLHDWDNGTVVCLKVRDEQELLELEDRIKSMSLSYRSFREPDTGNDMTALALIGKKNLFRELTLA
jgi:peptidyl-tRNA hydrolase